MWLVDVEEEKEGLRRHRLEPLPGGRERVGTIPLDAAQEGLWGEGDPVVIEVEAGGQAGCPPQHKGRDRCPRLVPQTLEDARQIGQILAREPVAGIVPYPMLSGVETGEERRMCRQGERSVGVGPLEEDRVGAQAVDGRGVDPVVAVGRQPIGAQGIDRDEDDGGPRRNRRRLVLCPSAGEDPQGQCHERENKKSPPGERMGTSTTDCSITGALVSPAQSRRRWAIRPVSGS